jgi:hypothetical protein
MFDPVSGRSAKRSGCGALACVIAMLAGTAAPAHASHSEEMIFDAPHELVEDQQGQRDRTLDELHSLGVDTVRVLMYWRSVAPDPNSLSAPPAPFDPANPGTYPTSSWATYDALITAAKARGFRVLLTTTGPIPRWASASGDKTDDPKPEAYREFMTAVATRYSGNYRRPMLPLPGVSLEAPLPSVDEWSIWNEPNVPYFLGPQYKNGRPYSPRLYRRLYLAGQQAIVDSGNRGDKILIGETGARGGSGGIRPLRFLRATLCLSADYRRDPRCAPLQADGWSTHPYTQGLFPRARPRYPDDVTIGSLDRLSTALDRAAAAGALSAGLPIYVTEFGVQSFPDPFFGVSLRAQAEYRSMSERIAWQNPRVASFAQYLMRDDSPNLSPVRFGGFESGLRTVGGRRKPAYAAFRLPLVVSRRGSRVRFWGLVRPAEGPSAVRVQSWDPGRLRRTTVRTRTSGRHFAVTARWAPGRRWRAVWTSPAGITHRGPWTRAY